MGRHDLTLAATYLSWAAGVASADDRRRRLRLDSACLLIYDGQTARVENCWIAANIKNWWSDIL